MNPKCDQCDTPQNLLRVLAALNHRRRVVAVATATAMKWGYLLTHVDLLSEILTKPDIQPDELRGLLKEHGFVDATPVKKG